MFNVHDLSVAIHLVSHWLSCPNERRISIFRSFGSWFEVLLILFMLEVFQSNLVNSREINFSFVLKLFKSLIKHSEIAILDSFINIIFQFMPWADISCVSHLIKCFLLYNYHFSNSMTPVNKKSILIFESQKLFKNSFIDIFQLFVEQSWLPRIKNLFYFLFLNDESDVLLSLISGDSLVPCVS